VLGTDIAGVVEEVGAGVTEWKPGDEIYADISEHGFGAFAEYKCAPANVLARKPANLNMEEAAAFPQASIVALQGLRDNGRIGPGQKVLVNGASGGVGAFAVQIAKAYGARVTGICGPAHVELVRSLGADEVVDYTQQNFIFAPPHYDLILDIIANQSVADIMEVLTERGNYVAVAFSATSLLAGPWMSMAGKKKVSSLVHKPNVNDLIYMKELIEEGKVKPVIDKDFPLEELPEAMRYVQSGKHYGKVVITINQ
jgi:NADPH:quinone reductase-like Zn-dependent oxidoreductase